VPSGRTDGRKRTARQRRAAILPQTPPPLPRTRRAAARACPLQRARPRASGCEHTGRRSGPATPALPPQMRHQGTLRRRGRIGGPLLRSSVDGRRKIHVQAHVSFSQRPSPRSEVSDCRFSDGVGRRSASFRSGPRAQISCAKALQRRPRRRPAPLLQLLPKEGVPDAAAPCPLARSASSRPWPKRTGTLELKLDGCGLGDCGRLPDAASSSRATATSTPKPIRDTAACRGRERIQRRSAR
jgi:hypothetical protein